MFGKKVRTLCCFIFALTLLFYAVPRLTFQSPTDLATGFSILWLLFALLVTGANLHHAMGLDYAEQLESKRKRYARYRNAHQRLHRKPKRLSAGG